MLLVIPSAAWDLEPLMLLHRSGTDSMVSISPRFRFYAAFATGRSSGLAGLVGPGDASGIQFLEMLLKPVLFLGSQGQKFKAHANTGIAGAHDHAGDQFLLAHPYRAFEASVHRQRQNAFYITTVSADVRGAYPHGNIGALVAHFQVDVNSVAGATPAIGGMWGRRWRGLNLLGEGLFPRAFLPVLQLQANLIFLDPAAFHHPHKPEGVFFWLSREPIEIANFRGLLVPGTTK